MCINCSEYQNKNKTICVQKMLSTSFELGIFMYWTCNSMNNLLSYCGLVDTRISASKKDLPLSKNLTVKNIDIYHIILNRKMNEQIFGGNFRVCVNSKVKSALQIVRKLNRQLCQKRN